MKTLRQLIALLVLAGVPQLAFALSGSTANIGTVTVVVQNGTVSLTGTVGPTSGGTGASNTATTGRYLKGDGTNFVTSTGSASGVGTCTNQFARVLNSDAAPTCATVSLTLDVTGVLPTVNGGTELSSAADDNVMVGNGTVWQSKALTTCTGAGKAVTYDASTNTFGCNTISSAGVPRIVFGTQGDITQATTVWASGASTDVSETRVQVALKSAVTINNTVCESTVVPGTSQSYVTTLTSGACTGALTASSNQVATIGAAVRQSTGATVAETISAGNCYAFKIVSSATAATATVNCSAEITG
jgi:hypothetical protein